MGRVFGAIFVGIFLWFTLFFSITGLFSRFHPYALFYSNFSILICTMLVGVIVATIARKRQYIAAISSIAIAYVPLAILLLIAPHDPLSEHPTFLLIFIVGIILIALATFGAFLSTLFFKKKLDTSARREK